MLLVNTFVPEKADRVDLATIVFRRKENEHFIELSDGFEEGSVWFNFTAAWCVGYEGLKLKGSGLIEIRFSVGSTESQWYSIDEARTALVLLQGAITIELRLRRSIDGKSPQFFALSIGYKVSGSVVSYINDIGLPLLLGRSVQLQRIVSAVDSVIEGVNPIAISNRTAFALGDNFLVNFDYSPSVIATQGEFQGGEVPVILVRLESHSNRRVLHIPNYLQRSETTAIRFEYAAIHDVIFEINIIAAKTQDVTAIFDRICQTLGDGRIDIFPFGQVLGLSINQGMIYDNPVRESDLAQLPTGTFSVTVFNVPIGQNTKVIELIDGLIPPTFSRFSL